MGSDCWCRGILSKACTHCYRKYKMMLKTSFRSFILKWHLHILKGHQHKIYFQGIIGNFNMQNSFNFARHLLRTIPVNQKENSDLKQIQSYARSDLQYVLCALTITVTDAFFSIQCIQLLYSDDIYINTSFQSLNVWFCYRNVSTTIRVWIAFMKNTPSHYQGQVKPNLFSS